MENNKVNEYLNKESEDFAKLELKKLAPIIIKALKDAYTIGFFRATKLSINYQKNHKE